MQRFFVNARPAVGGEMTLSGDESRHLATVLRIREGEKVVVIDGNGGVGNATVLLASSKASRVRVDSLIAVGSAPRVTVVFGLPKPPALEFILRRCAEVGVEGFQPLLTDRSQRFGSWNSGRWDKILREVSKQCETSFFPKLGEPVAMGAWFESRGLARGLAVCDETDRSGKGLSEMSEEKWDLLIGAEGGWSDTELSTLATRGARSVGLGQNRLRTETAALVGLVFLKQSLQEI